MMPTYCKDAEEIRSKDWKHCNFLKSDDTCNFSGSCDSQYYFRSSASLPSSDEKEVQS